MVKLHSTVSEILELFEMDYGLQFRSDQQQYAQGAWDMLPVAWQQKLILMEKEDLESITIGEVRDVDGTEHYLVQGEWIALDTEIDRFLNVIWESFMEGED